MNVLTNNQVRIVLKIGTATLTKNDGVDEQFVAKLSAMIAKLKNNNYEVMIVSSGAIGCGYKALNLNLDMLDLANKQALASIGQPLLMSTYKKYLDKYNILCSQLLCDITSFKDNAKCLNMRNCVDVLLNSKIVPIFNENDALSTDEIVFGDNDQLSASIAYYTGAKMLIVLSDIDGYYDKNPREHKDAKIQRIVNKIDKKSLNQIECANSKFATGGIVTKLKAANYLIKHKLKMILCDGQDLVNIESFLCKKEIKHNLLNNTSLKLDCEFVGTLFQESD